MFSFINPVRRWRIRWKELVLALTCSWSSFPNRIDKRKHLASCWIWTKFGYHILHYLFQTKASWESIHFRKMEESLYWYYWKVVNLNILSRILLNCEPREDHHISSSSTFLKIFSQNSESNKARCYLVVASSCWRDHEAGTQQQSA